MAAAGSVKAQESLAPTTIPQVAAAGAAVFPVPLGLHSRAKWATN
jgi:hypothetical protein